MVNDENVKEKFEVFLFWFGLVSGVGVYLFPSSRDILVMFAFGAGLYLGVVSIGRIVKARLFKKEDV